jgi:GNAT superfamily N-acetyltransferase
MCGKCCSCNCVYIDDYENVSEGVMTAQITFRPYSSADRDICLAIFYANCPEFFAVSERIDYERFLDSDPVGYELCLYNGSIAGAYGLTGNGAARQNLSWILLSPRTQRSGIGSAIMRKVLSLAKMAGSAQIHIAASHLSAPFFATFGAVAVRESKNGWGAGLHRIDMELHL